MVKMPKWKEFQEYVAMKLHPIDPKAKSTKGSGNCGQVGDVNNKYLVVECKDINKKNVYSEDQMAKVISECPLHSARFAVLCTRNQDGKMRAHMDLDTFFDLYVEYVKHMERCEEWDL